MLLTPHDPLLDRISTDPAVCGGKPVIRGTRIWVTLLLDYLAEGKSVPEILAEYPQLEEADVQAAIAHGAEAIRQVHHASYNCEFEPPDSTQVRIIELNEEAGAR